LIGISKIQAMLSNINGGSSYAKAEALNPTSRGRGGD